MAFERLEIPRHSVDARPTFVPLLDTAWDHDRIAEELRTAGATEDPGTWDLVRDHPWVIYVLGRSRCDLDAAYEWDGATRTARSYLRTDLAPLMVTLRRLDYDAWHEVRGILAESPGRAYGRACRLGVTRVDGWAGPRLSGLYGGGKLTEQDIGRLHDYYPGERDRQVRVGPVVMAVDPESLPYQIGEAVVRASAPPSAAEKKA